MSEGVNYSILGPGHYSLIVDGRSYEVFVREEKNGYLVEVNGHLIAIRPEAPAGAVSVPEGSGPQAVLSPMPGRVIGIKVAEGQQVKAGEGLIVVEAMKMENELQAARSGKVGKISVKVGDTVESGQELLVVG